MPRIVRIDLDTFIQEMADDMFTAVTVLGAEMEFDEIFEDLGAGDMTLREEFKPMLRAMEQRVEDVVGNNIIEDDRHISDKERIDIGDDLREGL